MVANETDAFGKEVSSRIKTLFKDDPSMADKISSGFNSKWSAMDEKSRQKCVKYSEDEPPISRSGLAELTSALSGESTPRSRTIHSPAFPTTDPPSARAASLLNNTPSLSMRTRAPLPSSPIPSQMDRSMRTPGAVRDPLTPSRSMDDVAGGGAHKPIHYSTSAVSVGARSKKGGWDSSSRSSGIVPIGDKDVEAAELETISAKKEALKSEKLASVLQVRMRAREEQLERMKKRAKLDAEERKNYENRIRDMETRVRDAEARMHEAIASKGELEQRLAVQSSEVRRLNNKIRETHSEVEDGERKLVEATKLQKRLEEEGKAKASEWNRMRRELESAREDLSRAARGEEIAALQRLLSETREQLLEKENQMSEVQKALRETDHKWQCRLAERGAQEEVMEMRLSSSEQRAEQFHAKLKEAEERALAATQRAIRMEEELQSMRHRLEASAVERDHYKTEVESQSEARKAADDREAQLNAALRERSREVSVLESEVHSKEATLQQTATLLSERELEARTLKKQLDTREAELAAIRSKYGSELGALTSTIEDNQSEVSRVRRMLDDRDRELEKTEKTLREKKDELTRVTDSLKAYESELKESSAALEKRNADYIKAVQGLKESQIELDRAQQKIEELEMKQSRHDRTLEEKIRLTERLRKQLEEKEEELRKLQRVADDGQDDVRRLTSQLKDVPAQTEKISQLENTIQSLQDDLDSERRKGPSHHQTSGRSPDDMGGRVHPTAAAVPAVFRSAPPPSGHASHFDTSATSGVSSLDHSMLSTRSAPPSMPNTSGASTGNVVYVVASDGTRQAIPVHMLTRGGGASGSHRPAYSQHPGRTPPIDNYGAPGTPTRFAQNSSPYPPHTPHRAHAVPHHAASPSGTAGASSVPLDHSLSRTLPSFSSSAAHTPSPPRHTLNPNTGGAGYAPASQYAGLGQATASPPFKAGGGDTSAIMERGPSGLELVHGPTHTQLMSVRGDPIAIDGGRGSVTWFREKEGRTEIIKESRDFSYQPCVDDISCIIRVRYTPAGASSSSHSHSMFEVATRTPVQPDPHVIDEVKQTMGTDPTVFQVQIVEPVRARGSLSLRRREKDVCVQLGDVNASGQGHAMHFSAATVKVSLDSSDSTMFTVGDGVRKVLLRAESHVTRDVASLCTRTIAQPEVGGALDALRKAQAVLNK
eukprot:Rmarinus@m.3342